MDRVMVNLTWRCNYGNCPYCWTNMVVRNSELYKIPDHDWKEWVVALNTLDPAILDFVGGEPFVFPHFSDLVNALDNKHYVAVTSNLYSQWVYEFLSLVPPRKVAHFTCSYHPTGKLSLEKFVKKLLMLKETGYSVSVNIIDHESIRDKIPSAKQLIESKGVFVHVSPYEHPPDLLKPNHETLTCNAGLSHYVINNNGDVYRCLSWFRHPNRKDAWMGNIFDGSLKKYETRQPCKLRCEMHYVVDQSNTMVKHLEIQAT